MYDAARLLALFRLFVALTLAAVASCPAVAAVVGTDESEPAASSTITADHISASAALSDSAMTADSACQACLDDCSGECCGDACGPLWIVRGGAVILHRSAPASLTLFRDTATGAELGNARQFDFGWAAGPDLAVWRRLSPGDYLEVRYLNVTSFTANQAFVAPGPFETNTVPPAQAPVGANINTNYASSLFSSEVNFRRQFSPWGSWLAGFRAIEVRDDLDLNAVLPAVNVRSHFEINAHNFFYGAQTGLDLKFWDRGGPLCLDGLFKVGLFGNAANQRTIDQAVLGGRSVADVNFADRSGQAAFVGEIALVGVYRLSDRLWLRGGYQLLWIDGLALATDQFPSLNFNTHSGISTTGGVFYHGALVGAELRF